ncbi:hypothetical protein HYV49_06185 [Candidatus Pacearchaeota archaeon]|nr:hypothetical protein [Candidatus Pacearchaeota archaeon]
MKKKLNQQQYMIIIGIAIISVFVIYILYQNFSGNGGILSIKKESITPKILSPVSENLGDKTKLDTFQVEFDQPVFNLKASDLSINGIPAKNIVGSGAGPYIFYGFSLPDKGNIKIVLSSGNIKNQEGDSFAGYSWTLRLFKYNEDDDGDGITNQIEIERKTDPTKKDTDGDGMDDAYEINNNCLNPNFDDSQADPDNDGIKNYQEYRGGTAPCR